jgi:hypothetical protein
MCLNTNMTSYSLGRRQFTISIDVVRVKQPLDLVGIKLLGTQLLQRLHCLSIGVEEQAADQEHTEAGQRTEESSLLHQDGPAEDIEAPATHGEAEEVHLSLDGFEVLLDQGLVLVSAILIIAGVCVCVVE